MGTKAVYGFGGRRWTPTECSALILNEMKRVAQLHLGKSATTAAITVPAYFRESQRQATSEAAHLAGLSVARIVNEPTAAALAYGYREPEKETRLLVFDLGGGTFDVTMLEVFSGVFEVRASGGESRLGGEDYTPPRRPQRSPTYNSNTQEREQLNKMLEAIENGESINTQFEKLNTMESPEKPTPKAPSTANDKSGG